MTRNILIFFFTFFILFGSDKKILKKKYAEKVHQYIIHESYKLLRKEIGADFEELKKHLGPIREYWAEGYQTNKISDGVFIEDIYDPVYGYEGLLHDPVSGTVLAPVSIIADIISIFKNQGGTLDN